MLLMDERDDLYEFWRQESPEGNFFEAIDANPRSGTICTALLGLVDTNARILEVGCNVGRNLNHLNKMGFKNLAGIEINPHAVERLRQSYPNLKDVPVHVGTAESVLPGIGDNEFDVVFTMAVLEHIHPDSVHVYGHIARIAKKHVLAIEPRVEVNNTSHRQHPWDVPKEYAKHGLRPIRQHVWSDLWAMPRVARNNWTPSFDRFDAIVFEHSAGPASATGRELGYKVSAGATKAYQQARRYGGRLKQALKKRPG
jgi:SAM-dependent methyltransferase